jgi:hypothetical protein
MGIGIDPQALVEEHLSIAALVATHEEDEIVTGRKLRNIRHTISHRPTDGVETLKRSFW